MRRPALLSIQAVNMIPSFLLSLRVERDAFAFALSRMLIDLLVGMVSADAYGVECCAKMLSSMEVD